MRSRVNIAGAALGVHALLFALLDPLGVPAPKAPPLEISVVVQPVSVPVPVPVPAPVPESDEPPTPTRTPIPRRPRRVATVRPAPAPAPVVEPEPTLPPMPAPSPEPAPAADSDAAVLLAAIDQAGRNGAAVDDGLGHPSGTASAARGEDFLRGAARGGTAPPHESRAAIAQPVEDYTRLLPPETSESILHDVSASVAVRVELDEQGRVVGARILKGAGYGLDEVAVETVKKYRFKPALDDEGRPVRSTFGWRLVFDSHWRRLMLYSAYGGPSCRGQGPLNLGSVHAVYVDCDGDPGYFELEEPSKQP